MFVIIGLLIMFPLVFVLSLLFEGIDRKIHARMQRRIGPPIIQPFYDFIKLLGKERITPFTAARGIFGMAPILAASSSLLAGAILLNNIITRMNIIGDLILILYLIATSSLFIMIGGSSSGNPFGALGFSRKATMFICCELPMVISIISVYMKSNFSMSYYNIIEIQIQSGIFLAMSNLSSLLAAISFLICIPAVIGVVPFDIPEAKTEIIYGPLVEYSGANLALLRLTKDSTAFTLVFLASTIFFYPLSFIQNSFLLDVGIILASCLFSSFILMLITITIPRTIFSRLKIGQTFRFYFLLLFPLSTVSVFLSFLGL